MPDKKKTKIFRNSNDLYSSVFDDRNVPYIIQHATPNLSYPSEEVFKNLRLATHVWKQGDKFYKLAQEYYGSTKYWWVIPWFNQKLLEADYKYGDKVFVPLDLYDVIVYF